MITTHSLDIEHDFASAGRAVHGADWRDRPVHVTDPDRRHIIAWRDGVPVGRLLAHVNPLLAEDGLPLGAIGWYECIDDDGIATAMLATARSVLADRGCRRVIGPIDGDTWHRYRVSLPSTDPPFFLDTVTPDWYSRQWRSAGFVPLQSYLSTEIETATVEIERIEHDALEFERRGVSIRTLDLDRFDEELATIHSIALRSFGGNFLYTPIDLAEFVAMYAPLRPVVVPEFVELAFAETGEPAAFCFALPDLLAPAGTRVVAKTAGRVPGVGPRGLGSHMIERVHLNAHRHGMTSVVHALMHEENRSRDVMRDRSRVIRRYELYEAQVNG